MPQEKILMHRISHCAAVSYPLLELGYVSIGWLDYATHQDLPAQLDSLDFVRFVNRLGHNKNRHCLIRFVQLKPGDLLVIPRPGIFSVYRVTQSARPICQLSIPAHLKTTNNQPIVQNDRKFLTVNGRAIDLGFFIGVEPVAVGIPRRQYAVSSLNAKLKYFGTNLDISPLAKEVMEAVSNFKQNKPINIYENIMEKAAGLILNEINTSLSPVQVEKLVKAYFERINASDVMIPPKNSQEKKDYEDADVVAVFDTLKTVFYVQVKKHRGQTGDWGVEQISHYKELKDSSSDYTTIAWLVSTADDFSERARQLAEETGVRLINGLEFSKMLLDVGMSTLNQFI